MLVGAPSFILTLRLVGGICSTEDLAPATMPSLAQTSWRCLVLLLLGDSSDSAEARGKKRAAMLQSDRYGYADYELQMYRVKPHNEGFEGERRLAEDNYTPGEKSALACLLANRQMVSPTILMVQIGSAMVPGTEEKRPS